MREDREGREGDGEGRTLAGVAPPAPQRGKSPFHFPCSTKRPPGHCTGGSPALLAGVPAPGDCSLRPRVCLDGQDGALLSQPPCLSRREQTLPHSGLFRGFSLRPAV